MKRKFSFLKIDSSSICYSCNFSNPNLKYTPVKQNDKAVSSCFFMMPLIQTTPTYIFFFFLISPAVSTKHVIIFLFSFEHLLFRHYPFGNMLFRTTTPNKISCDFPASVVSFPSTYLGRFSFTVNIYVTYDAKGFLNLRKVTNMVSPTP